MKKKQLSQLTVRLSVLPLVTRSTLSSRDMQYANHYLQFGALDHYVIVATAGQGEDEISSCMLLPKKTGFGMVFRWADILALAQYTSRMKLRALHHAARQGQGCLLHPKKTFLTYYLRRLTYWPRPSIHAYRNLVCIVLIGEKWATLTHSNPFLCVYSIVSQYNHSCCVDIYSPDIW